MITIKYGDAVLTAKTALLNEALDFELQVSELRDKAFDVDGKVVSNSNVIKLLKLSYEYFANNLVSVDNLKDNSGKDITLEDIKALRIEGNLMKKLLDAHKEAQTLASGLEDADPKKN